jgi:hypothetical protein
VWLQAMLQAGYDVTLQPVVSLSAAHVQQARFMGVDVLPLQSPATLQLDTDGACRCCPHAQAGGIAPAFACMRSACDCKV